MVAYGSNNYLVSAYCFLLLKDKLKDWKVAESLILYIILNSSLTDYTTLFRKSAGSVKDIYMYTFITGIILISFLTEGSNVCSQIKFNFFTEV